MKTSEWSLGISKCATLIMKRGSIILRSEGIQLPNDEVLNSKRNSVNVVKAITSKAVAVIKYGTKPIKWTEGKLKTTERQER